MINWQHRLRTARRIVIKLGTNTVTDKGGGISAARVEPIVRAIASLKSEGRQLVLVSSGAVGLGANHLGLARERLSDVVIRQACAAVGQSLLMHAYEQLFRPHGIKIAQVLLTEDDFTERKRYRNLSLTLEKLLKLGVLPVINENDTVSTAELEYLGEQRVFSDNDRLAALVMSKLEADTLVLLTNVDGLFAHAPGNSPSAVAETLAPIPLVTEITPELKALAAGPSAGGRGGMLTKLEAAQLAMHSGGIAVIANGASPDSLTRIFSGEPVGTIFLPNARMPGKRRWIAYAGRVRGYISVNAGAREAIEVRKASLLSSGILTVEGTFEAQDVVSVKDENGREFARGLAEFSSAECEQLAAKTKDVQPDSNARTKAHVLVSRDNIVLRDE